MLCRSQTACRYFDKAVNIAARLEGIAAPGAICLPEDAYRQVSGRLDMAVTDLGPKQLKNIERSIRAYSLQVGVPAQAKPATAAKPPHPKRRSALPLFAAGYENLEAMADDPYRSLAWLVRHNGGHYAPGWVCCGVGRARPGGAA